MNKSLSPILAWSGLLVSLYFVLSKEFEQSLLSPCVHHIYLAIPVLAFWLTKYFKKVFSYTLILLIFGIGGSILLFVQQEWVVPVVVLLFSLCFLPGLTKNPQAVILGSIPGVIMIFLWKMIDLPDHLTPFVPVFWVILFGVFHFFTKMNPTEELYRVSFSRKEKVFILIISLIISTFLLVWLSLPFYHSVYTLPGWIAGLFIFWMILRLSERRNVRYLSGPTLFRLFLALFFQTIFLGMFSRSAGVTHAILMIGFMMTTGWVVFYLKKLMDIHFGQQKTQVIFKSNNLWLLTSTIVLFFLILDLPACSYWYRTIVQVRLPENLFSLSLGQYFLKNVSLLPAFVTLITGILFLKRRTYFP